MIGVWYRWFVIIHIAVAKKVNEYLNRNKKELYLWAITHDAAKIIGIDRKITGDYDIGYYIHSFLIQPFSLCRLGDILYIKVRHNQKITLKTLS